MSNAHKFVSSKTREKETSTKFEQNGLSSAVNTKKNLLSTRGR